jgi:hypothetical protein
MELRKAAAEQKSEEVARREEVVQTFRYLAQ